MRKFFPLLIFLSFFSISVLEAAEAPILRALPVEKEKKPGLLQRIFGKKPTPSPVPVATPSPTPKAKKKKPRPAITKSKALVPLPDSAPPSIENSADVPSSGARLPDSLPPLIESGSSLPAAEKVGAEPIPNVPAINTVPTPVPPNVRESPLNQPIPLIDGNSAPAAITPEISVEAEAEQETVQRIQFRKIKAKALEDVKLLELKQKSELAASPAQRLTALKEYYPRLFASMRKLDETLSMEIDEMEAAARRRLERLESEESASAH